MRLIGRASLRRSISLPRAFGIAGAIGSIGDGCGFNVALIASPPNLDAITSQLCLHLPQTHDKIRKETKENEKKARNRLNKNGKYFVVPEGGDDDFKVLFRRLATAGAGRPVDIDGFPTGPWTPELLAGAISAIEANNSAPDLRTVQFWFQENDKGISADNIRWLARVFGCGDPEATGKWQIELGAAVSRLTAQRQRIRKKAERSDVLAADTDRKETRIDLVQAHDATGPKRGLSLAMRSEALFSRSPLNLSSVVFAGAVTLGFLAYVVNIHSITYRPVGGPLKQVGFLWAPNWTILFVVLMPLYLGLLVELIAFWKTDGRLKLLAGDDQIRSDQEWASSVEDSSLTFWAIFFGCLPIAGFAQWFGTRLNPLISGDIGKFAMDWGTIAIVRPEVISVPEAIWFTGLAYLYMCLCFLLFFVGLVLLFTLPSDFEKSLRTNHIEDHVGFQRNASEASLKLMCGIFRCTVLGLFIAILMKLQGYYLISSAETVVDWLLGDLISVLSGGDAESLKKGYTLPQYYSAILCVLAICLVFFNGYIRLAAPWGRQSHGIGTRFRVMWRNMLAVFVLLLAIFFLIGSFAGFSILLSVGVLIAIYSLFDPGLGGGREDDLGNNQTVL